VEPLVSQLPEVKAAPEQLRLGHFQEAESLLSRALDIVAHLPDPLYALSIQTKLAHVLQCSGDFHKEQSERQKIWSRVNEMSSRSSSTTNSLFLAKSGSALVVSQIRSGDLKGAQTLCQNLMEQFGRADNYEGLVRAHTLSAIVSQLQAVEHALVASSSSSSSPSSSLSLDMDVNENEKLLSTAQGLAKQHLPEGHVAVGDLYLHLGSLAAQVQKDQDKAKSLFQQALDYYEKYSSTLASSHVPSPVITALQKIGGTENLSRAVKLAESNHPVWVLSESLRHLGNQCAQQHDILNAEGLFGGASAKLRAADMDGEQFIPRILTLSNLCVDQAHLLCQLEWNSRSRAPEALRLLVDSPYLPVDASSSTSSRRTAYPTSRFFQPSTLHSAAEAYKQDGDVQALKKSLLAMLKPIQHPVFELWMADRYGM